MQVLRNKIYCTPPRTILFINKRRLKDLTIWFETEEVTCFRYAKHGQKYKTGIVFHEVSTTTPHRPFW